MMQERRLTINSLLVSSLANMKNLLLILAAGFLNAQQTPQQLVDKMGRGINLGNVLSAPVEGNWSGEATEQYFIEVADAGFSNVRIPIDFFGTRTSGDTSQYSADANTTFTGSRADFIVDPLYQGGGHSGCAQRRRQWRCGEQRCLCSRRRRCQQTWRRR